jgi:hypothetical protein
MPAVPNVPGVPALTSFLTPSIELLVTDAINLIFGPSLSTWTILLNGAEAFDFESIAGLGYKREWVIADYAVEDGSFLNYDKVQMPFEVRLRITSGGTEQERQALIAELDAAGDDLNLYVIVTPETTYDDVNIARITYDRSAEHSLGMIVADVTFQQIRLSDPVQFSNTKQPGSAGQAGNGNVQAQPPNAATQQALAVAGVM